MKETENDIDQLFRSALGEREFEIPEAFLQDLDQRLDQLDQGKKRRFAFYWPLLLVCCLMGVVMTFYWNWNGGSADVAENTAVVKTGVGFGTSEETTHETEKSRKYNVVEPSGEQPEQVTIAGKELEVMNKVSQQTQVYPFEDDRAVDHPATIPVIGEEDTGRPETTTNGTGEEEPVTEPVLVAESDTLPAADLTLRPFVIDGLNALLGTAGQPLPLKPPVFWEVQAYGGLNLFQNTLRDGSSENGLSVEGSTMAPMVGLGVNRSFGKWSLGAGLTYFENSERMRFSISGTYQADTTYSVTEYEFITDTTGVIIDTIIHQHWVQDTIMKEYSKELDYRNRYQWVGIPLSIGYQINAGAWSFIPRVGATVYIGTNTGLYPDAEFTTVLAERSTQWRLDYMAQLEVRYSRNRYHVFLRPTFQLNSSPFLRNDLGKHRYTSWGGQLGIGYKLR